MNTVYFMILLKNHIWRTDDFPMHSLEFQLRVFRSEDALMGGKWGSRCLNVTNELQTQLIRPSTHNSATLDIIREFIFPNVWQEILFFWNLSSKQWKNSNLGLLTTWDCWLHDEKYPPVLTILKTKFDCCAKRVVPRYPFSKRVPR